MARTPITAVRIAPEEKAQLAQLAAQRGMTLSEALRVGAWRLLGGEPRPYPIGRPPRRARTQPTERTTSDARKRNDH
jgi:hypothetical protein